MCSSDLETQVRPGIGKGETDPDMRCQRSGSVTDKQLPAHAEVGEQRVLAHRQPEVLPAPQRAGYHPAPDGGGEIVRAGQVAAQRARMQQLHRVDSAADNVPLKPSPDDLDFRQLGHA